MTLARFNIEITEIQTKKDIVVVIYKRSRPNE